MAKNSQVGKVYSREELLLIGKSALKPDKTYRVPKTKSVIGKISWPWLLGLL